MTGPYDQDAERERSWQNRDYTYIGQLVEAGTWECHTCFALVLDRHMHRVWHEELDRR